MYEKDYEFFNRNGMVLKTVLCQDGGTIGRGVPVETLHKSFA